jgi:hypothetical protein
MMCWNMMCWKECVPRSHERTLFFELEAGNRLIHLFGNLLPAYDIKSYQPSTVVGPRQSLGIALRPSLANREWVSPAKAACAGGIPLLEQKWNDQGPKYRG